MSNATAMKVFNDFHITLPYNYAQNYIMVTGNESGCQIFLPVRTDNENQMDKHKKVFQMLINEIEKPE